jgi:hypothetical protein
MYYMRNNAPALCHTSSLVEELGQIEYVKAETEADFRYKG